MKAKHVLKTRLTEVLGIEYPIMLAGMGSFGECTPPALVAAVSEAGGMGVIGGTGMSSDQLREHIRSVRRLTDRPFGVDLLMPEKVASHDSVLRSSLRSQIKRDFPEQWEFSRQLVKQFNLDEHTEVGDEASATTPEQARALAEVVLSEKVSLLACAFGVPSWVVPRAHAQGMKVLGLVGTVAHARKQVASGVDMLVATGTEAGGHTGRIATMPLVPQIVQCVKPLPVIAAGGIGSGRQLAAVLALGATGAWIGTAFLLATECAIREEEKQIIVNGRSEDFGLHKIYTGKPMRGFTNEIIRTWEDSSLSVLPVPFQKILLDDIRYAARKAGRFDLDANPAGQVAGLLTKIRPAAEIVQQLVEEAVGAIEGLQATIR